MNESAGVSASSSSSAQRTAIMHYAAPPVVGGVEAVIEAHVQTLVQAGFPVTVIAGRGNRDALPSEAEFLRIPRIDSQHPEIAQVSRQLREGEVPSALDALANQLVERLAPVLGRFDNLIVHNILTKRFNLPLTVALFRLLDDESVQNCIAWCHDIGWTSDHSLPNLHPGYPWDLLRTRCDDVTYVTVSEHRQQALADLFDCPPKEIKVIYNGVDPTLLLGLTEEGRDLVDRMDLMTSDLVLLMPVRVTEAKNIELALRVLAALNTGTRDARLVLTGPPDPHDEERMAYFRSLQTLRSNLGVKDEMRFVFECGPEGGEGFTIDMDVVADLFRVSDAVFMPSHREGFGMPVMEAGLVGKPVICTEMPAAQEIGQEDVMIISPEGDPEQIADRILSFVGGTPVHRLRRRVRQSYTWKAIFERDIKPLLKIAE